MMLRDLCFGNKWDEHPRWLVLDDSTSCKLKHLGFFDQWKISGDGDDSGWWYDGMSCSFSPNFVQKRCPPILLTWAMKLPKLPLFYHRGFRKSPDFLPQKLIFAFKKYLTCSHDPWWYRCDVVFLGLQQKLPLTGSCEWILHLDRTCTKILAIQNGGNRGFFFEAVDGFIRTFPQKKTPFGDAFLKPSWCRGSYGYH